jgi:nitrate reductase gamma subunit
MEKSLFLTAMGFLSISIFLIGLYSRVSIWLEGSFVFLDEQKKVVSKIDKLFIFLKRAFNVIFSEKIFKLIEIWFFDILLGRKLIKESFSRWLMHTCLMTGFLGLFLYPVPIYILGAQLEQNYKDISWIAFGYDLFSFIILIGILIAIFRRFWIKVSQLRTNQEDIAAVIFLTIVVVTGVFLESFRLLAESVSLETEKFSFLGSSLAGVLGFFDLNWKAIYFGFWYFHIFLAFAFIAFIPFGKFFHIFVSPVVIFINSLEGQE